VFLYLKIRVLSNRIDMQMNPPQNKGARELDHCKKRQVVKWQSLLLAKRQHYSKHWSLKKPKIAKSVGDAESDTR